MKLGLYCARPKSVAPRSRSSVSAPGRLFSSDWGILASVAAAGINLCTVCIAPLQGEKQMQASLRNERAENWLTCLAALTGATSLLLLIAVPIVRGEPLSDTAIMYAVYLMIASAAVCLAVNALAAVDLLREIFSSVKPGPGSRK